MKKYNYKIGNLEAKTVGEHLLEDELLTTIEIVKWDINDRGKYCYTIAYFVKDNDGFYLKSVGDRILLEKSEWENLKLLIKESFKHLNKEEE